MCEAENQYGTLFICTSDKMPARKHKLRFHEELDMHKPASAFVRHLE
jgi:hypothetical protein